MIPLFASHFGCYVPVAIAIAMAMGCTSVETPVGMTVASDKSVGISEDAASVSAEYPKIEVTVPTVTIAGVAFLAELASTPEHRAAGLSGRDSLPSQTGMLFTWETGIATVFWMKGMRFPLDLIWISKDCVVVNIMSDLPSPSPETHSSELPLYLPKESAAYTFEINAGEAHKHGIVLGSPVRFTGLISRLNSACG